MRAARARPRRPRARGEADLPAVRRREPRTRAPRWSRSTPADGLAPGARAARARGGAACASSGCAARTTRPASSSTPTLVGRICARLPGHRRARPGLPGARRRRPLRPLIARAREPRRRAHVLEGLRARRRARRLRPRAAGAGRGARRAAPARLDLVLVGGRRRAGLPRDGRAARSAAPRSSRSAAGWPPGMRARRRRGAGATRATSCSPARPCPTCSQRLVERGCAVRTFAHEPLLADCFRVTVSHRAAERPPAARARRAGGRRGAARPTTACAASARGEVRRATRETRIEVRLGLLGGGRRPRRDRPRLPRPHAHEPRVLVAAPTSTCAAPATSGSTSTTPSRTARIALGEALDIALGDRAGVRRFGSARAPLDEALAEAHRRPLGPRHRRARPRARRAGDRPHAARRLVPHFLDTLRPPRRGSACTSARPARTPTTSPRPPSRRVALALREAVEPDPARSGIASTKGVL